VGEADPQINTIPTCLLGSGPLGVCSSGSVPRTLAGWHWYPLSPPQWGLTRIRSDNPASVAAA
jgi:hypothetical protein